MKNRGLFIIAILFFLIINSNYYWEGKLGLLAFPAFLLLLIIYLVLAFLLFRQSIIAIKEKFADKQRLIVIGTLVVVLTVTLLKPNGVINFDKLHGEDLFVAEREGAANCLTILKLKENNTFIERTVCFGVMEAKGNYEINGDTVYFKNVGHVRHEGSFYEFAVVHPYADTTAKYLGCIMMYKNSADSTGLDMYITKDELKHK